MPAKRQTLPYGIWPSPISPAMAARGSTRIGMVQAHGAAIYWSETRPEEQGRQAIVRAGRDGRRENILPKPYSARSRVHEYGGGEFLVAGDTVYFVNDRDQQVHALVPSRRPRRITDAPGTRFADCIHDAARGRLIAVAEVHAGRDGAGPHALPRNLLVAISLRDKPGHITELAAGRDFYASARLSPDGRCLAYLAWDLPDMPWDSATLYVAHVDDSGLGEPRRIAGGDGSATFQPEWGPDGHLYFVWDETGWGSLYRWDGRRVVLVRRVRGAELWRSQWVFGTRCVALNPNGRFAAAFLERGMPLLETGQLAGGEAASFPQLQKKAARIDEPVPVGSGFAALVHSPGAMPAVLRIERGALKPVAEPPPAIVEPKGISVGKAQEFRSARGQRAFGIYYAPANPGYRGPQGALPPAIVFAHGGPTSMTDAGLKMRVQFYTSRGFAVFDVNYAGSTGYGRAYRQRLDGQWGIADVADCAAAARFLARRRLADPDRIAIAGGSAGGYTTLMALATTKAFAAGCSHYGISDLGLLMEHTHKFESGYLHRLLGTTPAEWKAVCAERSPLNLIDGIAAPVILFQGLDDKVVPPEQSRRIVGRLKARGTEVEYHEFPGEAHGFRKAETIVAVLEAELAFLQRVLRLG
jgi:dipeptidyl aminopeptidase/acylaminoacyl peptidase